MNHAEVGVKVWGEYALFTRPEFKSERVSYQVITPSAARGLLEAIFWKPQIRYEIRRIGVLRLGTFTTILRNEIEQRQGTRPIFVEDVRQQRASLVLKDVAYLIHAEIVPQPWEKEPVVKYLDQFTRRLLRGQYHHTPYLGTREFSCAFEPPDEETPDPALNLDLGLMLFDIAYVPSRERRELEFIRHTPQGPERTSGYAQALFFPAKIESGWLTVPPEKYRELARLEERADV
ncbi:type I-C CRISPR-associated protein Cas5c [Thermomicrobiaceae bacterium CFH 74404]|uniref:pre-crRNA processing endonuclease n=1 Tax=Thermalbibacter longus TaxID=2951981 RepID=A0AA41WE24_9BACT|nr:type I-C CRISPR-associated protein Cas5c [Thermalbibacter longus]MCM8748660.1 type I-C CRISPR-associated protein Cas5c [Thermalbibacter longus]